MAPRTFTVATSVQDPLTADRLVAVLQEAGLDAFTRAGGAASSDALGAATSAFFDVLVASEAFEKAEALLRDELAALERDAEANAQAAEEEALSGETPVGD
jgi:predicted Zn-dependent peptidase